MQPQEPIKFDQSVPHLGDQAVPVEMPSQQTVPVVAAPRNVMPDVTPAAVFEPITRPVAQPPITRSLFAAASNGSSTPVNARVPLMPTQPAESNQHFAQNVYTEDNPKRRLSFAQQVRWAFVVIAFVMLSTSAVVIGGRLVGQDDQVAQNNAIQEQDLPNGDLIVNDVSDLDFQLSGEALIVNGDIVTRGGLKFYNNDFVSSILQSNATAERTVTLPDADGTFCLDVNNCNFATAQQFNTIQTQVSAIDVPVTSIQAGTNVAVTDLGNGAFSISSLGGAAEGDGITLTVPEGGTGMTSFNANGVIYGNNNGALGVTAAGTSGQCLVGNTGSAPSWTTCSGVAGGATPGGLAGGDLSGSYPNPTIGKLQGTNLLINTPAAGHILVYNSTNDRWDNRAITGDTTIDEVGLATIQPDAVSLGTDTTGSYMAALGTLTGLSVSNNSGEGATPALSVVYGSGSNTAVRGNTSLTCPSGTGNLTGGGTSITLGSGGTCSSLNVVASPSFTGLTLSSALGVGSGGTGLSTYAVGDLLYASGATTLARRAAVASGSCLTSQGVGVAPAWGSCGVTTVGALNGQTKSSNGLVISGSTIYLQGADETMPGLVTTGAQTIAGAKTFTGAALYKNGSDTTTAFQIQTSAGASVITADTLNSSVVIGRPTSISLFANRVNYATGARPYAVTVADFSGDGIDDFATVVPGTTMSVFINNGNGTFAARVDYTTGSNAYHITSADFDGDDLADIAVSNSSSTTTSVFINNGDGTFAAKVDYATGSSPGGIAAADFNLDGSNDLVVANGSSNSISVFINNGDGTFAAKVDYATASSPYGVTVADLNGDGDKDIAASTSSTGRVSVFINNGDGTFAAKVDYVAGSNALFIAAADLDGDNRPELVTTNLSDGTMSLFINNGDGTFAAKVDYATGDDPKGVAIADFNADGKVDLAVTVGSIYYNHVAIYMNKGGAKLAQPVNFSTGTGPIGGGVGDFNNDTKPDFVVSNNWPSQNTVSVFLNTSSSSQKAPALRTVSAQSDKIIQVLQGAEGQTADSIQIRDAQGRVLSRISADGGIDLGAESYRFADPTIYTTGASPSQIASDDLNADSYGDIVVTNEGSATVSVLINDGDGTFATKVDYATGTTPRGVAIADLNADGSKDIAVVNNGSATISVLLNNGNGTFAAKVDYATGSSPYKVIATDLDGDGIADLGVTNNSSGTVSIFINNGDGTFAAKVDYTAGSNPRAISFADMNRDGAQDIIIGAFSMISALINNGDGTFAAKVDYLTGLTGVYRGIATSDVNKDGAIDLIGITQDFLVVSTNQGNNTFNPVTSYSMYANPEGVTVADLNGDTYPDIIASSSNIHGVIFSNKGDGTFAMFDRYRKPMNSVPAVHAADINNDNKPDMIALNGSSSGLTVYTNMSLTASSARLRVVAAAPNNVGQIIQGQVSQTADLFQVQDSNAASLFRVSATGKAYFSQSIQAGGATSGNNHAIVMMTNGTSNKINWTDQASCDFLMGQDTSPTNVFRFYSSGCASAESWLWNSAGGGNLFRLNASGSAVLKGALTQNGSPDVAENVAVQDVSIEAGDVVAIGEPNPDASNLYNRFYAKKTTVAYEAAIGVISTSPGILLNAGEDLFETGGVKAHEKPLAVAGRVPVKVSTENGAIQPGDYLTAAATPGHAMKATGAGSVIGQALETLNDGTGKILVLINPSYYAPAAALQDNGSVDFASMNVSGSSTLASLTVTGNVTVQGKLTVSVLEVSGNIKVGGHIVTTGVAPATQVLGTGISVQLDGNDTAGRITVTVDSNAGAGNIADIIFSQAFGDGKQPRVMLTPANRHTAKAQFYVDDSTLTNSAFKISAAEDLQAGQTYIVNYLIVE